MCPVYQVRFQVLEVVEVKKVFATSLFGNDLVMFVSSGNPGIDKSFVFFACRVPLLFQYIFWRMFVIGYKQVLETTAGR